jgi:hypothetical protein
MPKKESTYLYYYRVHREGSAHELVVLSWKDTVTGSPVSSLKLEDGLNPFPRPSLDPMEISKWTFSISIGTNTLVSFTTASRDDFRQLEDVRQQLRNLLKKMDSLSPTEVLKEAEVLCNRQQPAIQGQLLTDLVAIIRDSVYQNGVPDAHRCISTIPEDRLVKATNEVVADYYLGLGKLRRRLGSVSEAKTAYQNGLDQCGSERSNIYFELVNSMSQVLLQVDDDRGKCLGMVEDGLAQQTLSPETRAKLLIAKARFIRKENLDEKRQCFGEAVAQHEVAAKRSHVDYRLWKLGPIYHSVDQSILQVKEFMKNVSHNNFEVNRCTWRLIDLYCRKSDQSMVRSLLESTIPKLQKEEMRLEQLKAARLLELINNVDQRTIKFPRDPFVRNLAPGRRMRIAKHLFEKRKHLFSDSSGTEVDIKDDETYELNTASGPPQDGSSAGILDTNSHADEFASGDKGGIPDGHTEAPDSRLSLSRLGTYEPACGSPARSPLGEAWTPSPVSPLERFVALSPRPTSPSSL